MTTHDIELRKLEYEVCGSRMTSEEFAGAIRTALSPEQGTDTNAG